VPPRGVKKGGKRDRQYKHIKKSEKEAGRSEKRAEEIAARAVNKERARSGESRSASRSSTGGRSASSRGGKRSGKGPGGRTRDLPIEARDENGSVGEFRPQQAGVAGRHVRETEIAIVMIGPEDQGRVAEEEAEAAQEAARIGGDVSPATDDPARRPLVESGEGEAEGFELAERELEENASHGDGRGFPESDVPNPEEPTDVEYGEPDESTPSDGNQHPERDER